MSMPEQSEKMPVPLAARAGDPSVVLAAAGVSVRFGGVIALDKVDLEVRPGSILGLVGPNGAGKTTLFAVLSGLLRPTSGQIFMSGVRVTARNPQHRAHRGLARTFQRLELFPELTVREHVVLAHRARRPRRMWWQALRTPVPTAEEHGVVDKLLEDLELIELADRLPVSLPLGTGRLVEVGRALAADPKVVLLDEPSSGLSSRETENLARVLSNARTERGVALVLVEHNLDLVLGISDVVQVLDFGMTIATGTPAEIRADRRVQAAYLGTSTVA
jgi:ABC-type branched-subunit amino acid transport system ATPase component